MKNIVNRPFVVARVSLAVMLSTGALMQIQTVHASEFFTNAKPTADLRLRYENVNDDSALNDAKALTLRAKLGVNSGVVSGFQGYIEGEFTTALQDDFNSTRNGETTYLTVLDPNNAQLNRLGIKYTNKELNDLELNIGRQVINLDNQRFVGAVAFRQNDQTFDAVSLSLKPVPQMSVYYAYLNQVNTIFGEKDAKPVNVNFPSSVDTDSHLIQLKYAFSPALNVVTYGYLLELDEWGVKGVNSNQTYGLRLTGAANGFKYTAEYASQSDYAEAPLKYSADYVLAELLKGFSLTDQINAEFGIGYEVLGSDDQKKGFNTPLATKHRFNGWNDQFLATPADGLRDLYVTAKFDLPQKQTILLEFHDYKSDKGSVDYGDEIGVSYGVPLTTLTGIKGLAFNTKYSHYNAVEGGKRDTDKFWLQLDYRY